MAGTQFRVAHYSVIYLYYRSGLGLLVSDQENMPQVGDKIIGLGVFGPIAFRIQDAEADRLNDNSEALSKAIKSGRVVHHHTQLIRQRRVVRRPA